MSLGSRVDQEQESPLAPLALAGAAGSLVLFHTQARRLWNVCDAVSVPRPVCTSIVLWAPIPSP